MQKKNSKNIWNAEVIVLKNCTIIKPGAIFTPHTNKYIRNCPLQMPLLIVLTLLLFPGSPDYPHGITILSPFGSDKKQVLNFCAQSAEELLKFLEDLKESIAEVSEMEQIRIECEYHVFFPPW